MHVSSTEPRVFHGLGTVDTLPEKYGCDFLWYKGGWCGVQRKEVKDFIASVQDGRLGREIIQMRPLVHGLLVMEGLPLHTDEGVMSGQSTMRWPHWWGVLWQLQAGGIQVAWTRDKDHTARTVGLYHAWTLKDVHGSLQSTRESPKANSWGRADDREFQIHMLTGLPGVGRELAGRVVDQFDGAPLMWACTEEELCQVPGIGKVRARRMMNGFRER